MSASDATAKASTPRPAAARSRGSPASTIRTRLLNTRRSRWTPSSPPQSRTPDASWSISGGKGSFDDCAGRVSAVARRAGRGARSHQDRRAPTSLVRGTRRRRLFDLGPRPRRHMGRLHASVVAGAGRARLPGVARRVSRYAGLALHVHATPAIALPSGGRPPGRRGSQRTYRLGRGRAGQGVPASTRDSGWGCARIGDRRQDHGGGVAGDPARRRTSREPGLRAPLASADAHDDGAAGAPDRLHGGLRLRAARGPDRWWWALYS